MEQASKKAGDAMAKNLARGAEKAAQDVKKARKVEEDAAKAVGAAQDKLTEKISKAEVAARSREKAEIDAGRATERAAENVAAAQAKAEEAVRRYGAESEQAIAAEKALADARLAAESAALGAANKIENARRTEANAAKAVKDAETDVAKAKDKAAEASENVLAATKRYDKAQDGTNDTIGEASGLFERLRRDIAGAGDEFDSTAQKSEGFGDKLMSGLQTVGKGALLGVGAKIGSTVTEGIGTAFSKGFDRLQSVEQAKTALTGLGHSVEAVESIMGNAMDSVTGTAFAFGDAAGLAGTFVASGIEPGQELERVLKLTGDTAAITGSSLTDMGGIWAKVAANGKLSGAELSQLLDRQLGLLPALQEHLGVTADEARKMVSDGKVDFQTFSDVMENMVGGSALAMGDTFSGSLGNMQAALGRLGAKLLEPIFENAPMIFSAVSDAVDGMGEKFEPVIQELSERMAPVLASLAENLAPALATGFGVVADAIVGAVNGLIEFGDWVQNNSAWLGPLVAAVGGAAAAWGLWTAAIGVWQGVTTIATGIQGAFNAVMAANPIMLIVIAIAALVAGLTFFFTKTETGQAIWEKLTDAFSTGWELVKGAFSAAWDFISPILDGIGEALSTVGDVIGKVFSWVIDNWKLVATVVFGPMGAIIALAVTHWDSLKAGASAAFQFLGDIVSTVWHNVIQPVFGFFQSAAGLLADVVTGNWDNIGTRLGELGEKISAIINGAISAAMDVFKSIIGAVGGAWDTFRGKVGEVVEAVKTRVSDMVNVIREIPERIRGFFSDAGKWLLDAGKNIIGGLIDGIRAMAGRIGSAISDIMPDSVMGISLPFAGGGISAYAAGGIREAEAFANGGDRPNAHMPQIASGHGPVRVWGERETKGEAYIPFANDHRRPRAEAILGTVAHKFGKRLVNDDGSPFVPSYRGSIVGGQAFAEGGIRTEQETVDWVRGKTVAGVRPPMGSQLEGSKYVWGGGSANDWGDCSGMVSLVAGFIKGMWGAGKGLRRLFATGSQGPTLKQMGFNLGKRTGPGIFTTGWFNGGPYGGHTSAQIGSTRIEMGGARGNGQINGGAAPATHPQYTNHAWIKLKDAKPQTFDSMVSGSSTDAIRLGADSGAMSGGTATAGGGGVQWGAAQALHEQAARYLGVAERLSVSIPTAGKDARDPLTPSSDGVPQGDDKPKAGWGPDFFAHEVSKVAKDAGLGAAGAAIGVATKYVESGKPPKMYANKRVPESLAFKHDALGSDHDSVGLFQQRDNGAWGTVAQRMTPADSAKLFFDAMTRKYGDRWKNMDPGAVAQGVQVSAYPDRYGKQMAAAREAVTSTGLFDQGGVLPHGGLALNLSRKPEAILTNSQWGDFEILVQHLGALIPVLAQIARTGEFAGAGAPFGLADDSPVIGAARAVHQGWSDALTQIDAAQTAITEWGFTLGGDWLSNVKIVADAEEGLRQTREQGLADLETIEKAEQALAEARESGDAEQIAAAEEELEKARANGENAILELVAAERTVAAARITAVGEIGSQIFETFAAGADALAKFGSEMARMQGMVDATRQEVSKLHMERFNAQIKQVTSTQALRVAELDLERTRIAGIVAVARAEANLAAAQKGHLTMGSSSINGLASAVDRFRSSGVSAIDEIALTWVVNQAEMAEAEWSLRQARAQANLDEQQALQKQAEAAFAVSQATLQQAQAAYLLRAQTAHLAQQTAHLYGMSQQSASGLGRFAQGASGLLGGLGKIVSAVATGVAGFAVGGPLGAIPGVIMGLSAIPEILSGGAAMHANASEAKDAWNEMDSGAKWALGLGVLGSGASIGLGAYGSAMGMGPEALAGGLQVGQAILDATLGSMTGIADAHLTALNERFKWQTETEIASFELQRQLSEAQHAASQARFAAQAAALSAEVEVAKLRRELAAAEREGLDETVLAALRLAAETAESGRATLVEDARIRQMELDAAVAELQAAVAESRLTGSSPQSVTINMPPGDPSRADMIAMLEELGAQLGIHDLRINDLEQPAGTSAEDYVDSRR